jgi:hypothetical protein
MGKLNRPRILSSVPKGQKVATLNLEISPSKCSFIRNQKIVPKKKVKRRSKKSPFESAQKKRKKEKKNQNIKI